PRERREYKTTGRALSSGFSSGIRMERDGQGAVNVPRPRRVVKQAGVTRESAAGQGGTGPPTRGGPPPRDVHRNPQEDHAHVEPEEQWLRDEIVPQHEQRAQQEQRGDDRISPRAIASLHGGQAA